MNGPEEALTIAPLKPQQLSVAAARLDPPRLYEFLLPECTPIASRSRKYTPEDAKFIASEVQRLLAADIIEPARSPCRAQVLVVHQGPKKTLVIDYSTTISRFTLLDAYPLPNISGVCRKFSWGSFGSGSYDGHLHLVCAVCDVTI